VQAEPEVLGYARPVPAIGPAGRNTKIRPFSVSLIADRRRDFISKGLGIVSAWFNLKAAHFAVVASVVFSWQKRNKEADQPTGEKIASSGRRSTTSFAFFHNDISLHSKPRSFDRAGSKKAANYRSRGDGTNYAHSSRRSIQGTH
jgi:hypothetical protein